MAENKYSYLECVLITGASSGVGKEFAIQLAPISRQLILVARRKPLLDELSTQLKREFPALSVIVFAADLSDALDRASLLSDLESQGLSPSLLINNAGLGDYGDFARSEWSKNVAMLEVNMVALTHLTHALLPGMKQRKNGAIINVSSIASLIPIPDFTVYAATKAYVTSFSEGLKMELADENIPVLAVCPGPIKTEFGEIAAREGEVVDFPQANFLYNDCESVVEESLCALFENKARVYPGWKVAAFALAISTIPFFALRPLLAKRPRKSQKLVDDE